MRLFKSVIYGFLLICISFLLIQVSGLLKPKIVTKQFQINKQEKASERIPIRFLEENSRIYAAFKVSLKKIHYNNFLFQIDDCLEKLVINDTAILVKDNLRCSGPRGFRINLSSYIKPGSNTFEIYSYNKKGVGVISVQGSKIDPLAFFPIFFIFIGVVIYLFFLVKKYIVLEHQSLVKAFVVGVVLRSTYFFSTPPGLRSWDTLGHQEYVNYLLYFFSLPISSEGWQFLSPTFLLYFFIKYSFFTLLFRY